MRRSIIGTTVGLLLCVEASAWAQKTNVTHPSGGFPRSVAAGPAAAPHRTTAPIVIDLNSGIIPVLCPPDAANAGGTCGYLSVPLFRLNDDGSRIKIYFEAYAHSNPGSAISAIVPNAGGPGGTTTGNRTLWLGTFASNMDAHDLLLVDNRGTGQSATIDCTAFQHGLGPTYADEVAQCAAHLSPSNSQWGSGDVALDVDDVRKALGYELIDWYGGSWGGSDASAYATRFPQHVRSIILDSSDGPATMIPFLIALAAHGIPQEVRLDCQRSPTCGIDHADPEAELDALIRTVRAQPVQGYAQDANGNVIYVTVDEFTVGAITVLPNGPWQDTGELLAAGKALSEGDPLPLLRLGAEEPYRVLSDFGDPAVYSGGDQLAALCTDLDGNIPYSYHQPLATRLSKYQRAVAELPVNFFGPFSVQIGTRIDVDITRVCLLGGGHATRPVGSRAGFLPRRTPPGIGQRYGPRRHRDNTGQCRLIPIQLNVCHSRGVPRTRAVQ